MNHNLIVRNRLVMSGKALNVKFHCFPNILQRLSLSFSFAVAASQGRTERMITADGFFLQYHGIVHPDTLLAAREIVKLHSSHGFGSAFLIFHFTFHILTWNCARGAVGPVRRSFSEGG